MAGHVRQVVRQTEARVFQGITKYPHKIVSLFEPHTEIMRSMQIAQSNQAILRREVARYIYFLKLDMISKMW